MSLIVEVRQGKLQGRENSSVLTEQKYYTFSGIPYAKPPIGDLRFKDPQPYEKWEGIYDATYERDSCFQKSQTGQNWEGSEDCLYLNVNTPEIPSEIKVPKAVMVFIHGGGFFSGSGSEKMYSADYLIPHDVILVTMNYRLHVLGFLSLGIKECTGNAALKDQSLALKWVKENIKQFGGDPNNITVFGNSAGGASVHFQIISPLSKGLFNKAIIQSGDIFVPWAKIQFNPKDIAKQLGIKLGFVGDDLQKLVEFLRQQHIESLFDAYAKVTAEIKKKYPLGFRPGPFSPCIEEIKEGAFLPDSPAELVKNTAPLPIIYGVTDKEGYLFAGNFPKDRLLELNEDFSIILKSNFKIMPEKLAEVSAEVKKYFLCDENVGDKTAEQVTNLFSDIMYFQMYEAIDFVTSSSIPPYLYEYNYDKGPNNFKNFGAGFFENFESQGLPKNFPGASHGAEIPSIFFSKNGSHPPPTDPDRLAVIKNVTTLWTNFAKSGIPNNDKTAWTPSKSNKPCYLKINTNLEMTEGTIYGEGLQFLRDVLVPVIIPP